MNDGNGTQRYRLEQVERRLEHFEADRAEVWRRMGATEKSMAVIEERFATMLSSLATINKKLDAESEARETGERRINRGLWAAASTLLLFALGLFSAAIQLAT